MVISGCPSVSQYLEEFLHKSTLISGRPNFAGQRSLEPNKLCGLKFIVKYGPRALKDMSNMKTSHVLLLYPLVYRQDVSQNFTTSRWNLGFFSI